MAREIKATHTLYGKDAERFIKQMKENENKKASPEELAEIKKNAEFFRNILRKSKI